MTRIDSTRVKWRVQYRKSRTHAWKNSGLFETRAVARASAVDMRDWEYVEGRGFHGYGFGNTRVVRHISGKGKA